MGVYDCIIIGQGIAGSMLALELLERGKKILILDNAHKSAACLVAAGVLNPITGKRLVKTWRSDIALKFAKIRFKELEKTLGHKFFHDRKILQLCKSQDEVALWQKRKDEPEYANFLSEFLPPSSWESFGINDNFGSFIIEDSAWVEAPLAIRAFKKYFEKLGVLRMEKFDYSLLSAAKDSLKYKDICAKKIIFCEGYKVMENPYFSWLNLRPAKGEILTLKIDFDFPDFIIHKEKWIMKSSDSELRMGSTWDRENLNEASTLAAEKELLAHIPKILGKGRCFSVIENTAGVRPCTMTTRPLLGVHPEYKNIYLFNGFGSKGYALSPHFAKHFADFLYDSKDLDAEANLERHARKFFKPHTF